MKAKFPPASRTNDPESSKLAEKDITKSGKRLTQAMAVYKLLKEYPDSTSKELSMCSIATPPVLDRYKVARRLSDLENMGLVEKVKVEGTDENLMRMCRIGKKMSVIWRVRRIIDG